MTSSLFKSIISAVIDKDPLQLRIFNTLCSDVAKRQNEAVRLSKNCDIVLVIGGKISANTKRLLQICKAEGAKCRHIETEKDVKMSWFRGCYSVGIISGSSTPNWIVENVIKRVKKINL